MPAKPDKPVTDRQRRLCEFVVSGMPAGRAYERAGFTARGATADVLASQTLRIPKVARYLEKLREEAVEVAGKGRDDLIKRLWEIIETPVGLIDRNHVLCQEWSMDEKSMRVKMPPKLGAAKQLADIMGWSKPPDAPPVPLEIKVTIGGDV